VALLPPGAALGEDVEALKAHTVQMAVTHREGQEVGSGVVVCQTAQSTYVLTARHVLDGSGGRGEYGEPTESFSGVSHYEIRFYRNAVAALRGAPEEFNVVRAETRDLALLRIPSAMLSARLRPAEKGSAASLRARDRVEAYGTSISADRPWMLLAGEVGQVGEFIEYTPAIDGGFSGGPLFDGGGALVGINSQVSAHLVSQAIPLEEALRIFGSEMESECTSSSRSATSGPSMAGPWVLAAHATTVVDSSGARFRRSIEYEVFMDVEEQSGGLTGYFSGPPAVRCGSGRIEGKRVGTEVTWALHCEGKCKGETLDFSGTLAGDAGDIALAGRLKPDRPPSKGGCWLATSEVKGTRQ
jgi:hypothetical protein